MRARARLQPRHTIPAKEPTLRRAQVPSFGPSRAGRGCRGYFLGLARCQRSRADSVGARHGTVTAAGFEPAPLRNGAICHRLRPLDLTVLDTSMRSRHCPRAASRRGLGAFAPRVWLSGLPHCMPTGSAALQWHVNRAPLVGDQKSAALQIAHAGSRARVARMVSLCGAAPLGAPRALRNSPLPQWAARWRCERAASASAKASVCLGGKNKREREREREREERRSRGQTHKADSARSLPRRPHQH